ncbi:P-loop containing nucleoside triphosphate hydrolase protein [Syncephalastrum racemosum]|uniref:P-loop containing nucleoside triphosphate hydrolase protein n=1 Tax=Syncephalastrum racemosum TaxID=13706 RepID=A0A1X2HT32_SYNRA|nr:P-loop containing nucleoside triphosphate hydrolase protein [Syncephalastrum racemosum]
MMLGRASASQGQRCYSIMSKAKRNAGIPLDLIKPTKGTRLGRPHKPFQSPYGKTNEILSSWKDIKEKVRPRKDNAKRFIVKDEPVQEVSISGNRTGRDDPSYSDIAHLREPNRRRDVQDNQRSTKAHEDDTSYSFDVIREPESRVIERMIKTTDTIRDERQVRRELVLQPYKDKHYDLDTLQETAERWRQPAGIHARLVKVAKDIVQPENPHVLRVAVIGAANAGKSTLINSFVGESVSVVSAKAHTTRERVLGVLTEGNHQVIFLDTPGVIPDNRHARMNRTLVTSSWRSLDEADHVLWVVDSAWALQGGAGSKVEEYLMDRLKDTPLTLVFNKLDLVEGGKAALDPVLNRYLEACSCVTGVRYLSALKGQGIAPVKQQLFEASKPGPWIYPAEQKADMPDLKKVEELIRVEFFKRLHQYLPYMLRQENTGWKELPNGGLRIDQTVYVERDSQHKIVVGSNGSVINQVIEDAREQIRQALGKNRVQLHIQVKTKKR